MSAKQEALFQKWDEIVRLGTHPAGSRFRLRYVSVKGSANKTRLAVEHVDLTKIKKLT